LSTNDATNDDAVDERLQIDAYDGVGRGDDLKRELQSLEGPAIDNLRQSSLIGCKNLPMAINQKIL